MEMSKGYIFAELDIKDSERFYSEYMPRVRPILEQYGATFLIAGGDPAVVEGDRNVKRVVLLEFETPQRAKDFYFSDAYQEIIGYRFESAGCHLYFLAGVGPDRLAHRAS
ncbi:DUF1330 domain-containing protein [Trinickia violacea]|uniref:DUF1330 domain-containing protein n=1 Tax=Trinickia violacea TaxID=2571746 RepID=A0A4P8J070_9BURK|nr:DUF1330 domain-containing protein [Trinickia violacea]QCP54301.1 DUF1330 domain-containing protein [Trinickia violacea]